MGGNGGLGGGGGKKVKTEGQQRMCESILAKPYFESQIQLELNLKALDGFPLHCLGSMWPQTPVDSISIDIEVFDGFPMHFPRSVWPLKPIL